MTSTRGGWDHGFVAGAEALVVALAVGAGGSLLVANAWAVLDAKAAVTEAAREGARAYVEAGSSAGADAAARAAAGAALSHRAHPLAGTITVSAEGWQRCAPVTVVVTTQIHRVALPGFGGAGSLTVRAQHVERIDPYRSDPTLTDDAAC